MRNSLQEESQERKENAGSIAHRPLALQEPDEPRARPRDGPEAPGRRRRSLPSAAVREARSRVRDARPICPAQCSCAREARTGKLSGCPRHMETGAISLPSPLLCGSPEPAGPQTRGEIMAFAARAEEMGRGAAGMLRGGSGARLGGGGVEEGFLEEVMAKSSEISTV